MKKILVLFLLWITSSFAFGVENPDVAHFTVIKTTHNYSPVREFADINSKRATHLKKGATLYSNGISGDFYRVDLGLDKYYWIEKKYTDIETTDVEKNFVEIKEIEILEGDNFYGIKVKTPLLTAYNEIETSTNSLDFILYDVRIDLENLSVTGDTRANFKISKDKFENLKISYFSNYPLTGHEVVKLDDGVLFKVKKPFEIKRKKPLSKLVFALDPGHGGAESGACANGLKEKDLNLQISKILARRLEKEGAKVYLTRDDDTNPDLYERVDFAKENGADFLLSIHQNSLPNPKDVDKKHGAGVYYYNREARELSKEIQNALVEETGFRDDGVNLASFALTRAANPVCVLIECGYIIHPGEAEKLSDKKFQQKVANGITKGVKNYLKKNF